VRKGAALPEKIPYKAFDTALFKRAWTLYLSLQKCFNQIICIHAHLRNTYSTHKHSH
jgi:hypothetical protein